MLRHIRHHHARRRRQPAGRADRRPPRRPSDQPCATTAPARTSTATPNYILAAYPKPALLHRADPYLGLTSADFDAVPQWL
jgi:hypothetical protein